MSTKRKRSAPRKSDEEHSAEKKTKRGAKPKVAKRGSSSNIKFSRKKLKDWFLSYAGMFLVILFL